MERIQDFGSYIAVSNPNTKDALNTAKAVCSGCVFRLPCKPRLEKTSYGAKVYDRKLTNIEDCSLKLIADQKPTDTPVSTTDYFKALYGNP